MEALLPATLLGRRTISGNQGPSGLETDENIARGMPPEEARHAACRKFGNVTLIREEIYRMNTIGFIETLWQDLRHALRSLRRTPGFSAAAIVTLALGIGANTIIFGVVDAVFRPLPYRNPDQLVDIANVARRGTSLETRYFGMSRDTLAAWRAQKHIFAGIEAYGRQEGVVFGPERASTIWVGRMSPGMADLLGIGPKLGRFFRPEEGRSGNDLVVILSEPFWVRAFGADEAVLGKPAILDGRVYTIIGVMPREFKVPVAMALDAWVPLTERPHREGPGSSFVVVIARLRPGLALEQANREASLAAEWVSRHSLPADQKWDVELQPIRSPVGDDTRTTLLVFWGAVGCVLLIACANTANLLLSRAATLQREVAVRTALGASRGRLVRQFLVESLTLSLAGTVTAIALAWWGMQLIPHILPRQLPLFAVHDLSMNRRILLFTCTLMILASLMSGLAPALSGSRGSVVGGLTRSTSIGGVTRTIRRLHLAFQSLQIGLALVLLCGAGLMMNSFVRMIRFEKGYDADNLTYVSVLLPARDYPIRTQQEAFLEQLLARVKSLPGVRAATISKGAPPLTTLAGRFITEGVSGADVGTGSLDLFFVRPDYFSTLGIPIVSGRNFGAEDALTAPAVAIIERRAAEQRWPGQSALGKRFRYSPFGPWLTIVGVAGSVKTPSFSAPDNSFQAYMPLSQEQNWLGSGLIIRTEGDSLAWIAAVRSQVSALDRKTRVGSALTFDDLYRTTISTPRFYLVLLTMFAGVALMTAAVGVYGVLSYSMNRRIPEIGIRMAMGAGPADIHRLVLRAVTAPVALGLIVGGVGSYWLTQFLRSLLYQITPHDPLTIILVIVLMLLVAFAASYVPSRRASRIDPTMALRVE